MKLSELAVLAGCGYKHPGESEYEFCTRLRRAFSAHRTTVACINEDGLEGLVLLNRDTLHATVVFRGTEESMDVFSDIRTLPSQNLNGVGYVHRGVQQSLQGGWAAVVGTLQEMQPISVSFCGHSLGGMLAVLAATWCQKSLPDLIVTQVTTFGSPPVGSSAFATAAGRALNDKITHVVNCCDVVPRLFTPYLLGFRQPGKVAYLASNGELVENPGWFQRAVDRVKAYWSGRSLRLSITHHSIQGYCNALKAGGF